MEIFTAKVPVTHTERIENEGVTIDNTTVVGYLFTPNLLASMQEHKNRVNTLVSR